MVMRYCTMERMSGAAADRECLLGPLALMGQKSLDGLVGPELDFDVGLRGPGGPGLVLAVPARFGDAELLNELRQFVEEENVPVARLWLPTDPRPGFRSGGGEAVRVGDAGLVRRQRGQRKPDAFHAFGQAFVPR